MSADAKLKAYIDRILRCREAEDEAKQDTKDVYAELAAEGYEKTIVGQVVTFLRKREKDGDKLSEQSAKFDLYLEAYERPSHAHTRVERSDLGLNIQTKHTDIRSGGLSPAPAGLTTRPAEESVVPNSPVTATQSLANGPCEAVSERTATQVDASASAEAGVSGQPEMMPATSAESAGEVAGGASDLPTNSELLGGFPVAAAETNAEETGGVDAEKIEYPKPRQEKETIAAPHSDQPLTGGDHEVANIAERERETVTSNTGEGAARALPAKPKFVLRPHCLNPGKECGGSGPNHCWSCKKALEEKAA